LDRDFFCLFDREHPSSSPRLFTVTTTGKQIIHHLLRGDLSMPIFNKLTIRVAAIVFVLSAFATTAFAQAPEKPKKQKQSGWIGVMIVNIVEESSDKETPTTEKGARVESVVKKSPADSAGITKDDVIIAFGGTAIEEIEDLTNAVSSMSPGTKTTVTVMRSGEKKTLDIVVGSMKSNRMKIVSPGIGCMPMPPMVGEHRVQVIMQRGTLGMEVRELTEQLAEYFGAPNGEGVLVENVEKESPAAKAGFKAGDVIVRAGKKTVDEVEDIRKALRKQEEGNKLDFEVMRKGSKKILTVTIEDGAADCCPEGSWSVDPGCEKLFKFPHGAPGPDMKQLNIELEHLNKDLEGREKDLQKIIRKRIRISTDDEV
jgi:membrane-associated protease RseP (regulator of RpoE activity)